MCSCFDTLDENIRVISLAPYSPHGLSILIYVCFPAKQWRYAIFNTKSTILNSVSLKLSICPFLIRNRCRCFFFQSFAVDFRFHYAIVIKKSTKPSRFLTAHQNYVRLRLRFLHAIFGGWNRIRSIAIRQESNVFSDRWSFAFIDLWGSCLAHFWPNSK